MAACTNGSATTTPVEFDQARAWHHLETLVGFGPRPSGSEALERTRGYIEAELKKLGLDPQREAFDADTPVGTIPMVNLFADLEGQPAKGKPLETVILCAHYETKRDIEDFVGAADGGAGPSVLLEVARVLTSGGPRSVTYRFLFVDGEEAMRFNWEGLDNTYGSRHHAAQLMKSGLGERVRACVVIDIVGQKTMRLNRDTASDRRLIAFFFDAAKDAGLGKYVGGRSEEIKDDHQSFMAIGIPSVDLIDLVYPPWHTAEDTLDKCSAESLGAVGTIVLLGLPKIESSFRRPR
jgi:Zn-dependent M28 family amino/carboxypeptidase